MQSEPIKKLDSFANSNKQTQGKFTIGDEKARTILSLYIYGIMVLMIVQQHNVFMRLDVSPPLECPR